MDDEGVPAAGTKCIVRVEVKEVGDGELYSLRFY